jgi:hypothetical protein
MKKDSKNLAFRNLRDTVIVCPHLRRLLVALEEEQP